MNITKTKLIYGRHYCVFCNEEAKVVHDFWKDYYLCNCLDSRDYYTMVTKIERIKLDMGDLELKCNLEWLYRKMIQMELINEQRK